MLTPPCKKKELMRKLYLLITAALLLLSSSNAFAEVIATVGSTEFDTDNYEGSIKKTLIAALDASSNMVKAILQKDITPEGAIVISADKKHYLDLNNHTITRYGYIFDVYGALDIDGTGTLYSTRYSGAPVIIYVTGTSDPDEPYNHVLNIGENVTLKCEVG